MAHSGPLPAVCVTIEQAVFMRVSDRLTETTVDLPLPVVEVFGMTPNPALPGVVSVFHMSSLELYCGPCTKVGTSPYGITWVAPPWILEPTELLDGAIAQIRTSMYTNDPLNLELLRRHGKDWNYMACIASPTNWSMEEE